MIPFVDIKTLKKEKEQMAYMMVLIIFSIACIGAGFYLLFGSPRNIVLQEFLMGEDQEAGPLVVTQDNSIYLLSVKGDLTGPVDIPLWSFVEGELLDANREFLMGFGGEMWYESDYEGNYGDENYELPLVFAQKGIYYLSFQSESVFPGALNSITVEVRRRRGNPTMLFLMGLIGLLVTAIFWRKYVNLDFNRQEKYRKLHEKVSFGLLLLATIAISAWLETC